MTEEVSVDPLDLSPISIFPRTPQDQRQPRPSLHLSSVFRHPSSDPWWSRALSSSSALVEPTGIEPVTSCLQSRRSPS